MLASKKEEKKDCRLSVSPFPRATRARQSSTNGPAGRAAHESRPSCTCNANLIATQSRRDRTPALDHGPPKDSSNPTTRRSGAHSRISRFGLHGLPTPLALAMACLALGSHQHSCQGRKRPRETGRRGRYGAVIQAESMDPKQVMVPPSHATNVRRSGAVTRPTGVRFASTASSPSEVSRRGKNVRSPVRQTPVRRLAMVLPIHDADVKLPIRGP